MAMIWTTSADPRGQPTRRRLRTTRPPEQPMTTSPVPAPAGPSAHGDGGATILEIGQQPDAWREVAGRTHEHVTRFLRDPVSRRDLRVILSGAGSSAFAGEIAAPALRRHLGRRVDAVPTTDIVARPLDHLERHTPTLLVSFGRSGNSPESLATSALADELVDDVWHLVLTCDRDGQLGRAHRDRANSHVVFMPGRTNDSGFAMTSSLTSMLLSCLLTLGTTDRTDAEALARAAEHVIDRQPDIQALARTAKQRIVYLGSGPLEGLARESALKLLELTAGGVVTYFDSPLGFRHGPKAVLDGNTLVVVYISTDPYTRRYDLDIVAEIRAQLGPDSVAVISTEPIPAALGEAIVLPGLAGLDDSSVALAYVVFAQYLALFTALERGTTPDNPFPSGEVSRVVRGVTVYPIAAAGHPTVR
jgi:tagatose-6-phosphate ketose/aldose isomerase